MFLTIKTFKTYSIARVFLIFCITRFFLTIEGWWAVQRYGELRHWDFSSTDWLTIWGAWDSGWYLYIAEHGYSATIYTNGAVTGQATYAFFPLYPLLIRFFEHITHNYFASALLIANITFLIGLYFFYEYLKKEFSERLAFFACLYLLVFPTSFIFQSAYSESLFFMLLILTFWFYQQNHFILASIAGYLLGITRVIGSMTWASFITTAKKNFYTIRFWLFAACNLLGIVTIMLFNYILTGSSLSFLKIQSGWGRMFGNPLQHIINGLQSGSATAQIEVLFILLIFCVFAIGWKKISVQHRILSITYISIPLFSGVMSMPRYLLIVFPIYIILAQIWKKDFWQWIHISVLFAIQLILFFCWSIGSNTIY